MPTSVPPYPAVAGTGRAAQRRTNDLHACQSRPFRKGLFQKFVNLCSGRRGISLHDVAVSVNEEREGSCVELKLAGEEVPFIGREENMLALNLIFREKLLAEFAWRVFFVADVEKTNWSFLVFHDERALVEHSLTTRAASDAPEIHINDVASIFLFL